MNILILRVSAIGDVIHTLPSIFLIKKIYPNAKISWLVQKKAADLILQQNFLEKTYVLPDKFLKPQNWPILYKTIKELRNTNWNAIIDFQGIAKTSIIINFLKGKKFGFDSKNARMGLSSIFTKYHTSPIYTNIIQKNLALTSDVILKLGENEKIINYPTIEALKKDFKLNFDQKDKDLIDFWLNENKIKNFITFSPNTTWESKHWPEENWIELITKLTKSNIKQDIILIGQNFGQQGKNIADYIINNNLKIFLLPNFNLIQTAYLLSKTNLFIAPDTGLLHLTDFLNINNIGIFGPTLAKKHGPFLKNENIKNCFQIECPHFYQKRHGKNQNNSKEGNCMYKLSSETLFKKIIKILDLGEII